MDSDIHYLLSLQAVRDRARQVFAEAKAENLTHFTYDATRMVEVASLVTNIITRDFGPDKFDQIPPHGRWQHFDVGNIPRIAPLLESWESEGCTDKLELARRLIDLFWVSVLLDAGAGTHWQFKEPKTGHTFERSEGIAVASLYMFKEGVFSSGADGNGFVDGKGLCALQQNTLEQYFQVRPENPMVAIGSRVGLLNRVGESLLRFPSIFGNEGRPGNIVDFLLASSDDNKTVSYELLWNSLQQVLIPSWPANRTRVQGHPVGDAWPLEVLSRASGGVSSNESAGVLAIQPFHKLTQWLAYSLMVPFTRLCGCEWTGAELGTGLPEYRNGGLFVDMGVLKLKEKALTTGRATSKQDLPVFNATSDEIVEWRAMTVALLDNLYETIAAGFAAQGIKLSMAQVLEAGTWKAGRELAAKFRPDTKSSPILIDGDGTLF